MRLWSSRVGVSVRAPLRGVRVPITRGVRLLAHFKGVYGFRVLQCRFR